MARAILLVAGVAWVAAGLAGLALGLLGADALLRSLPPLAIGADALARTIIALAVAALLIGVAHLAVALGLGRGRDWAPSAGILLGAFGAVGFVTVSAAAVTSGVAGSLTPITAIGGGVAALLVALAYGVAAATLVHRLRSGGRS